MKAKTNRRKQIIADHLGKAVHAVVDRPIGYRHGDIVYPVNYGYIPGLFKEAGCIHSGCYRAAQRL